jgi:hypothetical protein
VLHVLIERTFCGAGAVDFSMQQRLRSRRIVCATPSASLHPVDNFFHTQAIGKIRCRLCVRAAVREHRSSGQL